MRLRSAAQSSGKFTISCQKGPWLNRCPSQSPSSLHTYRTRCVAGKKVRTHLNEGIWGNSGSGKHVQREEEKVNQSILGLNPSQMPGTWCQGAMAGQFEFTKFPRESSFRNANLDAIPGLGKLSYKGSEEVQSLPFVSCFCRLT
jgi:hypothetical protein